MKISITNDRLFFRKTQLCLKAQFYMEIAIEQAWDAGLIVHDVPVRQYRMSDYIKPELLRSDYRVDQHSHLTS